MKSEVYHIRVTLNGTQPPIWRRVAVASEIAIGQLHEMIQIVMGWTDSHLHQVILRDKSLKPSPKEVARRFYKEAIDAWIRDDRTQSCRR